MRLIKKNIIAENAISKESLKSDISNKVTNSLIDIVTDVLSKNNITDITSEDVLFSAEGKNIKSYLVNQLTDLINKRIS